jgi:tetratricopeptide (TPR) repeat protein
MKQKLKKAKHSLLEQNDTVIASHTMTRSVFKDSVPNRSVCITLSIFTFLVFILLWTKAFKPKVQDTWAEALELINLSAQSSSEKNKLQLLGEAGNLLQDVALRHPYHARVWSIYGFYFIQKQMWDSVIACEKKAIELGKGGTVNQVEYKASDDLCYALSMKLRNMQSKNPDESIILLKDAEVKGFENRCLIKLQGAFYTNLNKSDSALIYLNKAASMQPDADVYYNIALNYWRKGDKDRAVENLRKALATNKDHEPAKKMLQEISK